MRKKNKMTQCHNRMPLMITDTPSTVFAKCGIDIIGPFSPSRAQHRNILKVQDELSKFLIAVPLEDQTAEQVAKAFVDKVVLIYGIPQEILTDCGSQFLGEIVKGACKLLGIENHPFNQLSNKRSHKGLIEYLRMYVDADLSNWDQWVKYAVFVHNTTPHSASRHMPFQLLFGRLPNLPGVLQRPTPSNFYSYDTYVKELEAMLQSGYVMARRNLEISKIRNKRQYVPTYEIGEKVLFRDEIVRR